MPTHVQYTIYLVNHAVTTQNFRCDLEKPAELAADPTVFAKTDMSLAVDPNSASTNRFTIPAQYIVGAGSSDHSVEPNNCKVVDSTVTCDAYLRDRFSATYADVPPKKGPGIAKMDCDAGVDEISIKCNDFDRSNNECNHWFSSQSFGINSENCFIGMIWSPEPGTIRTFSPQLAFKVSIEQFGAVSTNSAVLRAPKDFHPYTRDATVTYTSVGEWTVSPGPPPTSSAHRVENGDVRVSALLEHQRLLQQAHLRLIMLGSGLET